MRTYTVLFLCIGTAFAGILNRELRVTNVCTQDATGPIYFPHPTDSNKFLQCAPNHRMFVITCPEGEVYHHATTSCDKPQVATTSMPTVRPVVNPNPGMTPSNPCTPENLANKMIFFPYPSDRTKFIECSPQGQPTTLSCPPRLIYDGGRQSCVFPTGTGGNTGNIGTGNTGTGSTGTGMTGTGTNTGGSGTGTALNSNPCPKSATSELFFPHPSDKTLYIQCDLAGDAYIMHCPANLIWSQSASRCDSRYPSVQSNSGSMVG